MLTWFFLIVFLAIAVAAGALAYRSFTTGEPIGAFFFAPRPEKRLGVVEQASVDGRRKLLLIRRDDVEHLILTGGPVDVVVETGIGAPQVHAPAAAPARVAPKAESETPGNVFSRPARTLGQVVNE
jgi:flagellar protein FliO/FliZ